MATKPDRDPQAVHDPSNGASTKDEEQQRVYDELVRAGVPPERTADRVTD
jgi:hypothetical protein